jgi:hypothetical protein
MELDFSEQIRRMPFVKAALPSHESNAEMDMQTKKDNPEMAMKNKSVCKVCAKAWGSCSHASDSSNEMEEGPVHENTETKDQEDKEDIKAAESTCKDCNCGMSESECTCSDCTSKSTAKKMDKYGDPNAEKEMKMEKSMSEKDSKHPDKEDKKDVESEKGKPSAEKEEEKSSKDKKKFPFDKSKASLCEKVAHMLQSKVELYNSKYETNLTFAQLNKVYSRGLNVFNSTHKPGISLHQWAIARVNLFIKMLSGGHVRNEYQLLDADIAHASNGIIIESGLASYDFIDFSDLEFQLAKIALIESGISENEMNLQISEST